MNLRFLLLICITANEMKDILRPAETLIEFKLNSVPWFPVSSNRNTKTHLQVSDAAQGLLVQLTQIYRVHLTGQ